MQKPSIFPSRERHDSGNGREVLKDVMSVQKMFHTVALAPETHLTEGETKNEIS